ncbi:MAG: class I SAM-dependent methyltransferase [Planctomycetota bacterium]|jgi:SAM-dependent methyltransferase
MDVTSDLEKEWFKTAFGRLYPILYAHRDDGTAAQEAESLARVLDLNGGKARILDVCCGSGRHAEALAGMGFEVVGSDLSPFLLDRALVRQPLSGRLARADIRNLPFHASFDVVVNLFTSFGYFLDDAENDRSFAEMVRVLAPGGRLVLDHINRSFLEKGLIKKDSSFVNGYKIRQRRRIEGNRIVKDIEVDLDDGEHVHLRESVRLYDPEEMEALFDKHGLLDVRFHGSFEGGAFTPESLRMIIVGTKE